MSELEGVNEPLPDTLPGLDEDNIPVGRLAALVEELEMTELAEEVELGPLRRPVRSPSVIPNGR